MITTIMYVILSFVPVGIVAIGVETWRHFGMQGRRAAPNDKLLRPPGESCRRKIEEFDTKIWETALWTFGFPVTLLLCYLSYIGTNPLSQRVPTVWFIAFILTAVALVFLLRKLAGFVKVRNYWHFRFFSERAVGEHLNQLMVDGCRVFHDVPLPDNDRINHVVIAPSGIFVIQTQARCKDAVTHDQQAHEVVYDGRSLEFARYTEVLALADVRSLASRLRLVLGEILDPAITVKPVLTFPGWYVIHRGDGDVIVVNPKKLDSVILSPNGSTVPPEKIKQIARVFEQKCCDVEF